MQACIQVDMTYLRQISLRFALVLACAVAAFSPAWGQNTGQNILKYEIDSRGDTIFVDEIRPARIHPSKYLSKREWRARARRVHNFSKAYPYALFIAQTIRETDSLFEARGYNAREQEKYLNSIKDDLLNDFEPLFKGLTLSQGLMMIRLIDREVGMPPYDIIRKYLGRVNAAFWQGSFMIFTRISFGIVLAYAPGPAIEIFFTPNFFNIPSSSSGIN